jgi:hypothetical protein
LRWAGLLKEKKTKLIIYLKMSGITKRENIFSLNDLNMSGMEKNNLSLIDLNMSGMEKKQFLWRKILYGKNLSVVIKEKKKKNLTHRP